MTRAISARLIPDTDDYEVTYASVVDGKGILTFDIAAAGDIGPVLQSIDARLAFLAANPADPAVLAARELDAKRRGMSCTRMQGILALGPVRWAAVMAYHDTATWAERVVIDSASDWQRLSQHIQFFAYLLDLSATDVDDLFITAAGIEA